MRFVREDIFLPEDDDFGLADELAGGRAADSREKEASAVLRAYFGEHRERVFFSRQLEVQHEQDYFHWVTNRALRDLRDEFYLGRNAPA